MRCIQSSCVFDVRIEKITKKYDKKTAEIAFKQQQKTGAAVQDDGKPAPKEGYLCPLVGPLRFL